MELIDQETAKIEEVIEKVESMTPERFYRFITAVCGAYLRRDAAPVMHGRWEVVTTYGKTALYRCTACKTEMVDHIGREDYHRYCHICGARMDGGERHETD